MKAAHISKEVPHAVFCALLDVDVPSQVQFNFEWDFKWTRTIRSLFNLNLFSFNKIGFHRRHVLKRIYIDPERVVYIIRCCHLMELKWYYCFPIMSFFDDANWEWWYWILEGLILVQEIHEIIAIKKIYSRWIILEPFLHLFYALAEADCVDISPITTSLKL